MYGNGHKIDRVPIAAHWCWPSSCRRATLLKRRNTHFLNFYVGRKGGEIWVLAMIGNYRIWNAWPPWTWVEPQRGNLGPQKAAVADSVSIPNPRAKTWLLFSGQHVSLLKNYLWIVAVWFPAKIYFHDKNEGSLSVVLSNPRSVFFSNYNLFWLGSLFSVQ